MAPQVQSLSPVMLCPVSAGPLARGTGGHLDWDEGSPLKVRSLSRVRLFVTPWTVAL